MIPDIVNKYRNGSLANSLYPIFSTYASLRKKKTLKVVYLTTKRDRNLKLISTSW